MARAQTFLGHAGDDGVALRAISHRWDKARIPRSQQLAAIKWWNTKVAPKAPDFDNITDADLHAIGRDFLAQFGEFGPTMWDSALDLTIQAHTDGVESLAQPPELSEYQARKFAENMDAELEANPDLLRDPFLEQQRLDLQYAIEASDAQDALDVGNDVPPDMSSYSAPQGSRSEVAQLEARMRSDPDAWWHPDNQASRDRFNELHGAPEWASNAPTPTLEQQPRPARWWDESATTSIEEEMTTDA